MSKQGMVILILKEYRYEDEDEGLRIICTVDVDDKQVMLIKAESERIPERDRYEITYKVFNLSDNNLIEEKMCFEDDCYMVILRIHTWVNKSILPFKRLCQGTSEYNYSVDKVRMDNLWGYETNKATNKGE